MLVPQQLPEYNPRSWRTDCEVLPNTIQSIDLRDKFVVCCGGPRITHELAKELGYDAGFGAGKYADDVASFAVTEMVKRGMK